MKAKKSKVKKSSDVKLKQQTIKAEKNKSIDASTHADSRLHKPRDSIFSLTSGFTKYEGLVNWAFLLLGIGGLRLSLENLNKYGVRVNPSAWVYALWGNLDHPNAESREFPTLFLFLCK
jgi:diacylglycerol O-acyltransferase-1